MVAALVFGAVVARTTAPPPAAAHARKKEEKEVKVPFAELSSAVQATFTREAQGADIKEVDQETKRNGEIVYEADVRIDGKDWEVKVAADGRLLAKVIDDDDEEEPASAAAGTKAYKLARRFGVPGEGGWDYLTYDGDGRRLFVTRSTRVVVVDPESGRMIGEVPDTPGVHGVALAADLGRGFTSNGRENTVSVFDLQTLQVTGKLKVGENPDAILYHPSTRRVFVFNGRSADATVIDGATRTVVGTIPLGGKPEFGVSDEEHVFVNIEDKGEIVVLDPRELRLKARWSLAPCEEPTGLALDREAGRLFAGCGNRLMAVVDAKTGRVLATPAIGGGVDSAAFDPGTHLAFSSNGEGTLTVVAEGQPGRFDVVQTVPTEPGARTMALDPKTHTIYLATARFGPRPAPTAETPRPRPPIVPDSFVVLVVNR
jgi:YVTN family beta-propeller protein